ncbi:hypothetical protein [Piscirickettsia litoralis]|uniref:Uncharacterized protein n=1 Tax=Piscirickettsia litoralis TaxID=1891921 RepID=A0ABX3A059_9GAMM|nr:hypothetical protein [Piscirickettsia litoralis]ODN41868.1 hypothetical protein BGC07_01405 [Piscirickettsia litoralis]
MPKLISQQRISRTIERLHNLSALLESGRVPIVDVRNAMVSLDGKIPGFSSSDNLGKQIRDLLGYVNGLGQCTNRLEKVKGALVLRTIESTLERGVAQDRAKEITETLANEMNAPYAVAALTYKLATGRRAPEPKEQKNSSCLVM